MFLLDNLFELEFRETVFFLTETRTVPNAASFAFPKKSLTKKALRL